MKTLILSLIELRTKFLYMIKYILRKKTRCLFTGEKSRDNCQGKLSTSCDQLNIDFITCHTDPKQQLCRFSYTRCRHARIGDESSVL